MSNPLRQQCFHGRLERLPRFVAVWKSSDVLVWFLPHPQPTLCLISVFGLRREPYGSSVKQQLLLKSPVSSRVVPAVLRSQDGYNPGLQRDVETTYTRIPYYRGQLYPVSVSVCSPSVSTTMLLDNFSLRFEICLGLSWTRFVRVSVVFYAGNIQRSQPSSCCQSAAGA